MTFIAGDFVHTSKAHPNNVYEVLEVGTDWLLLDVNGISPMSVDLNTVTAHELCDKQYCHACIVKTRKNLAEFRRILAAHSIDEKPVLEGVTEEDRTVIASFLYFAHRINPTVQVIG